MKITSTDLIYFSPTQTTKKIIESISKGLQVNKENHINITLPQAGRESSLSLNGDLAIIGAPVYGGRLPAMFISRFSTISGKVMPAVIVVVYGNRAYDDALIELKDVVLGAGFKPIGAGAFIGEHSYSTNITPIAVGRPDVNDIENANLFGGMVREKMMNSNTCDDLLEPRIPGNSPYKEIKLLSGISPDTIESLCTRCNKCISVCPVSAINRKDPATIDKGLCIRCCACVKICEFNARIMDDPLIKQAAGQLSAGCSLRKEPEIYL
jgi:ferredoxin/flavodoxin